MQIDNASLTEPTAIQGVRCSAPEKNETLAESMRIEMKGLGHLLRFILTLETDRRLR